NNVADIYGTDPTTLQGIANYINTKKDAGDVNVVTVSEGLHLIPGAPAAGDGSAPTITAHDNVVMEGNSPTTVTYTVPAVTDNVDTVLTAACNPISDSIFAVGPTTVTCNAADTSGNLATSTFTVTVQDSAPVITGTPADMVVEATSASGATVEYIAPTANDAIDGLVTVTCVPASGSTFPIGDTTVTCSATDSGAHTATSTFTVTVQDSAPVITINGGDTLSVEYGSVYADAGATASDAVDGTLTVVVNGAVDTSILGEYKITYSATDSHGNNTEATRTVKVVDTTKPVITLLGDSEITIELNTPYTDAGATASDNYDGDLTTSIATENPVDIAKVGDYTITYNVSDSSLNAAVEVIRTVHVVDTTVPTIELIGDNPQVIEAGTAYAELGATVTDNYDAGLTAVIDASAVNTNAVGSYNVIYDATDSSGNKAVQLIRIVNVQDIIKPIVTIDKPESPVNAHPFIVFLVTDFTPTTAECKINDGAFVPCTSPFPLELTTGTYTVTVRATDQGGNTSDEVTSDEFIVDADAPVITINSAPGALINVNSATIEFTVTGDFSAMECKFDGSDIEDCASPIALSDLTEGEHKVTVKAVDALGNESNVPEVIFTVDMTAPTITADLPVTTNDTTPTITGTTTDNTANILVTINSIIYTATPESGKWSVTVSDDNALVDGVYTVSASSIDAANNGGTASGELTINTQAPNLTVYEPMPNSTEIAGTTDDDAIVVITVNGVDYTVGIGNPNWTITLESISEEASYPVNAIATDPLGNSSKVSTTLIVDVTNPVITLIGDATIDINVGDAYTDAGATATDNVDGDITANIVVANHVDANVIGTYLVTFDVLDAAGHEANQVFRTVNVKDLEAPVITLNGNATVDVIIGGTYTDAGATATDNVDGNITANIIASGTVDTATVGTYTINYNVSDAAGNPAVQVTRTVNVKADTTKPVITIIGSATMNITVGETYTDAGATATDNVDGNITDHIVKVNSVDSGVVGTYTVTYNVSDAAGNKADQKTRTVNVNAQQVAMGGGGGAVINSNPPTAPIGGYVLKINNGALRTSTASVTLTINGGAEARKMTIVNGDDFANTSQEDYAATKQWTLTSGDGTKKVCAKFYSQSGFASAPVCAQIILGGSSILDFNNLMINWGQSGINSADLNGDGKVDILDFNLLMVSWS
ncbi:MAG: DUF5011 domain-containing protein, partial [Candidatus Pacebacteria bacterium]|nr:DUF5011 domain-containing protein [Candidatus Paceibacterota bacterium]